MESSEEREVKISSKEHPQERNQQKILSRGSRKLRQLQGSMFHVQLLESLAKGMVSKLFK